MYVPAVVRNRESGVAAEVAHMYPACFFGSRAVAMMGLRTRLGLISGQVDDDPMGSQTLGAYLIRSMLLSLSRTP
jgi:hypothetical protein